MANYIIIGGDNKEYGPVTEVELKQWIAEGRLNRDSRAKAESDAEFRPLWQFPELASAFNPSAAPGTIAPPGGGPDYNEINSDAEILTRDPELRLGECLGAGWSFLGANAGFLAGAVPLVILTNLPLVALNLIIPILGPLVMVAFNAVIMGGFYLACLRRLRGEAVSPAGIYSGFTVAFGQLLLTGLVSGLLMECGFCCVILPGIYLAVAWFFAVPLAADRRMFFWSAMEMSRKVVTRVWFELFILVILAFLPVVISTLVSFAVTGKYVMDMVDQAQSGQGIQQVLQTMQTHGDELRSLSYRMAAIGQVVLLLNLFYASGVIVRAYENLFGPRKP